MDKAAITVVLEKLGPERVERGLVAFQGPQINNVWTSCFLGRALRITEGDINACRLPQKLAGLGNYGEVTEAFDATPHQLHGLVLEWLEQNRVAPVAPALVAVG